MKIGDFRIFKNNVTVICGHCDYYDVYMIDIDEYRIELSDNTGMVIGTINSDYLYDCEIVSYDEDGYIDISGLKDLKDL